MSDVVTITRGSVTLLHAALSQPEWAKTTQHVYSAGKTVAYLEDTFTDPPPAASKDEPDAQYGIRFSQWANATVQVRLSPSQKSAIKACFVSLAEAGKLASTRHYVSVADACGFGETE